MVKINIFLIMIRKWKISQGGMDKDCVFAESNIYRGKKRILTPSPHVLLQQLHDPQTPHLASTGGAVNKNHHHQTFNRILLAFQSYLSKDGHITVC